MAIDPYAAPMAPLFLPRSVADSRDAKRIRDAHYLHECGVRAVGVACGVFGAVMVAWCGLDLLGVVDTLVFLLLVPPSHRPLFGVAMAAAGVLAPAGAWGYARLRPWVRWIAPLLACGAVLASFGLATPMAAYAAWLTWARKGRFILSGDYAAVVAQARGWPRWWQWGHALVITGAVVAYSIAFHGVMTEGILPDQD